MAEVIGECGFKWVVADVLGKCAVGAGLVSAMATRCDVVWLEAA